jgi:ferredoxin
MGAISLATIFTGAVVFAFLVWFAVTSLRENEPRAASRALALSIAVLAPYLAAGLLDFPYRTHAAAGLLALTVLGCAMLIIPWGSPRAREADVSAAPRTGIDERDTMFSRAELGPGTARFEEYYRRNPAKKTLDDNFRAKPGLLDEASMYYEPLAFHAADANFSSVAALWPIVDGEPSPQKAGVDPHAVSRFVERWARQSGAVSVGITELRDYHLYTVLGRRERYGEPGALDHRYAIAFTVEMDKDMVGAGPCGPTVMESSQQYLHGGMIAVQVAQLIRNLGYRARAHIDGNYHVVCPLVARDAGLGEIGRMGLLMTPELGPRVRISVVTTDLPLLPLPPRGDPTVVDFCERCTKCAAACPSRAIPFETRREIDGALRWRIDSEACYTYWCVAGTDCARCVSVCPYSHPGSALHRIVRRGIRHSSAFRRFAAVLDDFFYGKVPPSASGPDWIPKKGPSVRHPRP